MNKMDGFDSCVVGLVAAFGRQSVICYDQALVIAALEEQGMSYDEAVEFFWFNQIGAYVGDGTPAFLERKSLKEIEEWITI